MSGPSAIDRDLDDIFAIQDEISKAIVAALKVKLLPDEKKAIEQRGTTNVEAYKLYLLARQYWVTGNHGDPRRERAGDEDLRPGGADRPALCPAWALMAHGAVEPALPFPVARRTTASPRRMQRCRSIQSIAEAHLPMIRRLRGTASKQRSAMRRMKLALQLGPGFLGGRARRRGNCRCFAARSIEATEHFEKALEAMDSDFHGWALLSTCYRARKDKENLRLARRENGVRGAKGPRPGSQQWRRARHHCRRTTRSSGSRPMRAREWIDRAMLIDPRQSHHAIQFRLRPVPPISTIRTRR